METPIYDFLKKYEQEQKLRLHMPGHKGKSPAEISFAYDITEINGADSLFEADGIIAQSEKNASALFKTKMTCYSAGGSTLCIQTMLSLAKFEKRSIIAARNVHRSFLSACALLDIQPQWIYPDYRAGFLSGEITVEAVEKQLKNTENACVYITSPDYLGKTADIKAIAEVCHRYDAILLVDNAHGAHTAGTENHPIIQGADMCCDSAHKMLPCLTGGAYLHINYEKYISRAKQTMSLFASTSPSYLIMASLDLCNDYIENQLQRDTAEVMNALEKLRKTISEEYTVYSSEPFHLTLLCNGIDLAEQLREKHIECEYADKYCIVLLFSPKNTAREIEIFRMLLMLCDPKPALSDTAIEFPHIERKMSIREAVMSESETINVDDADGRICAMVNVPCPPAVPIAVSGEVINKNLIKIFKNYGISVVNVIK